MKTILITGGAGFIASNFARYLLKKYDNYKIIIVDALTYAGSMENIPEHERVEFWYGDVRNADLIGSLMPKVGVVARFAAETANASIFDNKIFLKPALWALGHCQRRFEKWRQTIHSHITSRSMELRSTSRWTKSTPQSDEPLCGSQGGCGPPCLLYTDLRHSSHHHPSFNNYGPSQPWKKWCPVHTSW